jgi:hypothetical protein
MNEIEEIKKAMENSTCVVTLILHGDSIKIAVTGDASHAYSMLTSAVKALEETPKPIIAEA